MSVFIRADSKDGVYSYDFRLGGRRFSGSTGKTARKEALAIEREQRLAAKAARQAERGLDSRELTIEQGVTRPWAEVGQHHRNAANTMRALDWLISHFGKATMLHDIDDARVAAMVAKRRGERVPSARVKGRRYRTPERIKLPAAATVNRTATQPLRELLLRAAGVWQVRTAKVTWSCHLLAEPKERVREASAGEESAIMGKLERGYDDAIAFAFLNGCRRMEILGLAWSQVDFFGKRFTVTGKGGHLRTIPMSARSWEILKAQLGHHPEKVFTFVARRTVRKKDGELLCRGQRYPMTESGLKTAMRRAVAAAGVVDFHFHDTRHTAATRVLRKSNLRVVQKLLGHADIQTTAKYAHAMDDDIRDALEATSTPAPAKARGTGTA